MNSFNCFLEIFNFLKIYRNLLMILSCERWNYLDQMDVVWKWMDDIHMNIYLHECNLSNMDECHLRMIEYNSTIMDVFIHSFIFFYIHPCPYTFEYTSTIIIHTICNNVRGEYTNIHVLYIRSSEEWMLKSQPFDWVEASFLFVKAEHLWPFVIRFFFSSSSSSRIETSTRWLLAIVCACVWARARSIDVHLRVASWVVVSVTPSLWCGCCSWRIIIGAAWIMAFSQQSGTQKIFPVLENFSNQVFGLGAWIIFCRILMEMGHTLLNQLEWEKNRI